MIDLPETKPSSSLFMRILEPGLTGLSVGFIDAAIVCWLGHRGIWSGHIVGFSGDTYIYLWFLHWWAWSRQAGLSWTVTHLITVPYGSNILWDTTVPIFFIPASFVHLWWHIPVHSLYDLLWVGFWAGSAWVAYYTFLRITGSLWGSFLGQFLVLFSAYENTESLAHLDLMWLGFMFLFFWVVWERLSEKRSRKSFIVWGTLFSLAQWLSNEELFVMMWIAAIIGLIIGEALLWGSNGWDSPRLRRLNRELGLLMGLTCLVLLPFVWLQTHTPLQPLGSLRYFSGIYGIDLQNLLIVPVHTLIHWGSIRHWTGNINEDCGYLGIPFLASVLGYWWFHRKKWKTGERRLWQWLTIWCFSMVVLSLGAFVHWNGHSWAWGVLPGLIFYFIPLLGDMVLPRFMAIAFWGFGLGAALLFSRMEFRWNPRAVLSIIAWAAVVASWIPQPYPQHSTKSPNLTTIPSILKSLKAPAHPTVLVFPYDNLGNPTNLMMLQSENHFSYRLAEGYLGPTDYLLTRFTPLVAAWDKIDAPHRNPLDRSHPFPASQWRMAAYRYLQTTHPYILIIFRGTAFQKTADWWSHLLGATTGHTARAAYWVHPLRMLRRHSAKRVP